MEKNSNPKDNNDLFISSQIMIVVSYTIFSAILIGESIIMKWEMWAVLLIVVGVTLSWYLHINHVGSDSLRLWIVSILMMATFFFYGSHETSTYDLAIVMATVIVLYTMTAKKSLITLCQWSYYITMSYEIINMLLSGTKFDALLVTRTIMHFGMITMICWIARIIIEKWNEVLGQSREEINMLTAATEKLGDFLANISHEIRTPINAILGLCDMALEKETDTAKRETLESIEDAGKKIGEQISDILDYSEIDGYDLTNNYEDYMLSSVLNDLVNELKPYMRKDVELMMDVDASIPSVMNTDVVKLKKILWHLVSNGLKFTNEGGVYVHISSIPHDYGINLCIEVRDTGIGMNASQLEMIYDNFYKADSGRARRTGGLGLGMPIVHGFVRSLGGFMTVESEEGHGTRVRVSIPNRVIDSECCMSVENRESFSLGAYLHFDKYPNPEVREYYDAMVMNIVKGLKVSMHRVDNTESLRALVENKKLTHLFAGPEEYNDAVDLMEELAGDIIVTVIANPGELNMPEDSRIRVMPKPFYCFPVVGILNSKVEDEAAEEGRISFPGVRILVVDDEPMNLIVSNGMLKGYGMIVTTCESGQQAIELCRDNDYDVIFMDHMMPGMDGVEAMKRIRNDQARSKIMVPIIAFTANAVSSAREMFRQVGFDGFVSKPVDRVELERVLKRVLPNSYVYPGDDNDIVDPKEESSVIKADETPAEAPKQMSRLERLSSIGVDVKKGLYYCRNDEAFYNTLLEQYAKESGTKKQMMSEALAAGDMSGYSIQVHSIKSTSKMIGATELSDNARILEDAAKEENRAFIDSNHDVMVNMYDRVLKAIDPDVDDKDPRNGGPAEEDDVIEFGPVGDDVGKGGNS